MSDESRFVPMSDLLGSNANSWADDPQEQASQPEAKPKSAWGKVEEVKAIDIAQVAEEDRKKKKEEASGENAGWTNVGAKQESGSRPSQTSGYTKSESYERRSEREPKGDARPRNPLPDNPPFTAFVGNLSYEVDNHDLTEFFEGLNVKEARVVKDNGKSKGFGYVEFGDRASLEKALTANQTPYKGRNLNIDVASQKPSAQWGPGSGSKFGGRGEKPERGGFSDNRGGFGNKGFGGRGFSRGPPPPGAGERPKLDLKPRTKPLDNPPPSNATVSTPEKKPGENPFGFDTSDRSKLDKAAEDRLKLEQQREQKRKDELAKLEQERDERKNQTHGTKKEWRSGPPNTSYGGRGGGVQNSSGGRGSNTQKKESSNNNNSGAPPKRGWEKPTEQKKSDDQNQKKNIYDVLGDEGADEGDDQ